MRWVPVVFLFVTCPFLVQVILATKTCQSWHPSVIIIIAVSLVVKYRFTGFLYRMKWTTWCTDTWKHNAILWIHLPRFWPFTTRTNLPPVPQRTSKRHLCVFSVVRSKKLLERTVELLEICDAKLHTCEVTVVNRTNIFKFRFHILYLNIILVCA